MRRIGSPTSGISALLGMAMSLWAAGTALATEIHQSVDRTEVGTEDTFQLTVTLSDAPGSAELKLPRSDDFEILSKSQSSQVSFNLGAGARLSRQSRHVLLLRANRSGTLTIPPAELHTEDGVLKAESISVKVKEGKVATPNAVPRRSQRPWDPFSDAPFEDFDLFQPQVAQGESDLFLRATSSAKEVYVGEQVTYALYIFSRVDLSSVDAVVLPKLEGFWGEDMDTPTQLAAEQKMVNGVPYRAYLLRRRALFPMKPGEITIEPARADVTTGFLFAGRQVSRQSSALHLKVKPLPPHPGANLGPSQVGSFRLSAEMSDSTVELGQPVTVRVIAEGTGNLKQLRLPALQIPPGLKRYDPTLTDHPSKGQDPIGGKRVQEYLVMPQKTGVFELPGLELTYFDPSTERYQVARTAPLTLAVTLGSGVAAQVPSGPGAEDRPPQTHEETGIRPIRVNASLDEPGRKPWRRPLFLLMLAVPPLAWGLWALASAKAKKSNALPPQQQRATLRREVGRRLETARKASTTNAALFYQELERAIAAELESQLGAPVLGLTREVLVHRLKAAGVDEVRVAALLSAMDVCDAGRFAPIGDEDRAEVLQKVQDALNKGPSPLKRTHEEER